MGSCKGLSEGVCLVILRVRGVSLGVVLGSGLGCDSVQCLGLDSYLGFVCSRETGGVFFFAWPVGLGLGVLLEGVCLVVLHVGDVSLGVLIWCLGPDPNTAVIVSSVWGWTVISALFVARLGLYGQRA